MLQRLLNTMSDTQRRRAQLTARIIEALLLVIVLFSAGFITAQWYATQHFREDRAELMMSHQKELERTTNAYKNSLDYLTRSVGQNASTVQAAANTAQTAASTADRAANAANRALANSGKLPEPTRQQLNRSIDAANRQVK